MVISHHPDLALYLGHFALAALINGQIAVEQAQGELK